MKRHFNDETDIAISKKIRQRPIVKQCSFDVYPIAKFDCKFPFFRQPKEIGAFSHDEKRQFQHNRNQLKYYRPPENCENTSFDLSIGYKTFIKRDDSIKENLDNLLRWILLNRITFVLQQVPTQSPAPEKQQRQSQGQKLGLGETCLNTDFVCWRGLLTKLLCTPYEQRDDWQIAACKYNGTYYLCEFDTPSKIDQKQMENQRQQEMSYWGYKFEQYVTAAQRGGQPNTKDPVNNSADFGLVVRSRLSKHSLVFGGEVDCQTEDDVSGSYVELKTSREMNQPNQVRNFKRFKLIKWWAQSFLLSIPTIVCGFRDDDGVVQRLQRFTTLDIPKYCQDIPNCWEPAVCLNFCDQFLQFIKDTVVKDDASISYVFTWRPRQCVTCTEYPACSEYSFLPSWYTDAIGRDEPTA